MAEMSIMWLKDNTSSFSVLEKRLYENAFLYLNCLGKKSPCFIKAEHLFHICVAATCKTDGILIRLSYAFLC